MDVEVKPTLAQRIDDVIRDAMGDVIAEAREEGWRTGYAAGRLDVRREMNGRLRALILEEEQPEPSRGRTGRPCTRSSTTCSAGCGVEIPRRGWRQRKPTQGRQRMPGERPR